MESPNSFEEKEAKAPKPADKPKDNSESANAADAVTVQVSEAEETSHPIARSEDPKNPKEKEATESEQGAEIEESPSKEGENTITENTRRGKRIRKSTVNYTVEEKSQKERKIPNGKGEKLEQMPNVVDNFKAITWSDSRLQDLYSIVFGKGKKKMFKEHLLQFNGVVYPEGKETEKDKILAKMYKLKMDHLKSVMDLADIDRSVQRGEKGDKEGLCRRFLAWLENPEASGKKSSKKRGKRKPTSDKASTKKARAVNTPAKKIYIPKTEKFAAKSTPKSPPDKASKPVQFNIPGVGIEKVRAKVKIIVENAEKADLTVKGVRKLLEDWLDTDLTDHKDVIRSLVMDVI